MNTRRHMQKLCIAAALQAVLSVILALLSRRFAFGSVESDRPIPLVLMVLAAQFAVYVYAIQAAVRCTATRKFAVLIFAAAAFFRLVLLPTSPIQEIDIYRYIWDGAVTTNGINPYRYAPATILGVNAEDTGRDELHTLVRLRDESPSLRAILARIHYADLSTIYPPVSQSVFAAALWLTPQSASVELRVTILKSVLTMFDLSTAGLVWVLLGCAGRHPGWTVAYAWCPLIIKEISNGGHLDSISVFLTALAALAVVKAGVAVEPRAGVRFSVFGALTLALAIGAKLYAVVLLPSFAAVVAARLGIVRGAAWLGLATSLSILLVSPMIVTRPVDGMVPHATHDALKALPPGAISTADAQGNESQTVNATASGLAAFLAGWEMNDWLFMIVVENLRPEAQSAEDPRQVWFAVVPNSWRESLVGPLAEAIGVDIQAASFMLARAVTACAFVLIALVLAQRVYMRQDVRQFLEVVFLTLAWFWLLSPTQNPWYWIWAMPFLPFARNRAWYAVSGLVMTYYLRFWLLYHYPDAPTVGTTYSGTQFFDFVVSWLEYGLWFLWLGVCWYQQRKHTSMPINFISWRSVPGFTESQTTSSVE
ncbi:MAG: hypothetical protein AB7G28_01335 [Pirellulales bacterium]